MWRKRMQDLSRAVGRPHAPLFAPVLFGVAAQLEAIDPQAMAVDAIRLRKNVGELRRMLKTDAVFCSAPSDAEVQALTGVGGEIDAARLLAPARIAASLEAVRQWQADASEPVIVAALQGPASIAAALRAGAAAGTGGATDADDEALFDHVGRGLAALARLFCEAGVQVIQWHETVAPQAAHIELWKGALGTAGNVARFHRVAPVLVMATAQVPTWPVQAVASPALTQHAGAMPRPHGRSWPADPAQWPSLPGETASERLVTTLAEVPADTATAALLAKVQRVREGQA